MVIDLRQVSMLNKILQKKMGRTNPNPFLVHQIHIFIEN